MGTVVNIVGMGMGLVRQHMRGWGGLGNWMGGMGQMFGEQVGAGLQLQPRAKLSLMCGDVW